MASRAKKTEHAGAKNGKGAYWGYKKDAKKESNRVWRETDKAEAAPANDEQGRGRT